MKTEQLYNTFLSHPVVSTDTRNITPDSLFFALKGKTFNGDEFAEEAIKKGAAYSVVSNAVIAENKKFIKVADVLETLQSLAHYHRKKSGIKILSITGSNGKTTTKELCKAIIGKKFNVLATAGNLNNHIGVPLTLLSFTGKTNFGIVEMGANHPGEIKQLCEIASPDFGMITNVGKAHLEGFGSIEGVARAKGEMFDYLIKKNGVIFLNNANPYLQKKVDENYKNIILYNDDVFKGEVISADPYLKAKIHLKEQSVEVNTKLVGKYNIENILAAATIGYYFDISKEDIKDAIESYIPDNNRSQLINTQKNKVILDAYNANPSSMKNAIENFIETEGEEKVVILGQMLELGEASENEHRMICESLLNKKINRVILVGSEFKKAAGENYFDFFENVENLIVELNSKPIISSTILVKGSRGNRLEKIVPVL